VKLAECGAISDKKQVLRIPRIERLTVDVRKYLLIMLCAKTRERCGEIPAHITKLDYRSALGIDAASYPGNMPFSGKEIEGPRVLH